MKQTHILNIMFGVHILFQYLIREANVFRVFWFKSIFIQIFSSCAWSIYILIFATLFTKSPVKSILAKSILR